MIVKCMLGMMTCSIYNATRQGDFAEMQIQSRGRLAIVEIDPLALERQVLYAYVGDLLLRGHVIDDLESAPLPLGRRIDVRL